MIRRDTQSALLQTGGNIFHFITAVTVNDAALAFLTTDKHPQLIKRFIFFHQCVADIRAVKAADVDQRITEAQPRTNIRARGVIGGSRQGNDRHTRQMLAKLAYRAVFRPEIVSPLRDTVRFIHRQQRRLPLL